MAMLLENVVHALAGVMPYISTQRERAITTRKAKTSKHDPVTVLDYFIQMQLMRLLTEAHRGVSMPHLSNTHQTCHMAQTSLHHMIHREHFVAEEEMDRVLRSVPQTGFVWIIDSIDGTRVYCEEEHEGQYTTMVAAVEDGQFQFSVIADIADYRIYCFTPESIEIYKLNLEDMLVDDCTITIGTIFHNDYGVPLHTFLQHEQSLATTELFSTKRISHARDISVICRKGMSAKTTFAQSLLAKSEDVRRVEGSVGWMMKEAVVNRHDVLMLQAGREGLINFPWDVFPTLVAMESIGYDLFACTHQGMQPLHDVGDISVFCEQHDRTTDICAIRPGISDMLMAA